MTFPRYVLIIGTVIAPAYALSMVALAAVHHPDMTVQHLTRRSVSTIQTPKQATLGTTTAQEPTAASMPATTTTHSGSTIFRQTGTSSPAPTTSSPAPTSSPTTNNQPPSSPSSVETTITIHVGGYPPATSTALTTDFENPIYVPCGGQYPSNAYCPTSFYEWVATKYCIVTYADGHTVKDPNQYLAYDGRYADPYIGTLNPSGTNMTVTSNPITSCDVAHAPKSVFEPNYTY